MALVTTPAVVLRTYPYSETSKIVRLATRDLGVQSAIAKGVLRPKSRFAAGLELLSEGMAQLYHRETRELQTLAAFDLLVLRRELAQDVGRFAGATAQAELMFKMAPEAPLAAAHRRLFARFVRHHFGETSTLPALDFWERHAWSSPLSSAIPAPAPAPAQAPTPAPAPSAAS